MTEQQRIEVRRIQRAHWRLLLQRRGQWTGRQLLEHYREHVERAPDLVGVGSYLPGRILYDPNGPVEQWWRKWGAIPKEPVT